MSDSRESTTSSERDSGSGSGDETENPKRKRHAPENKPIKSILSSSVREKKDMAASGKKKVTFSDQQSTSQSQPEANKVANKVDQTKLTKSYKAAFDRKYGPVYRQMMKKHHVKNRFRVCTWYNRGTCNYRGLSHYFRGREVVHACIDCYRLAGLNVHHRAESEDCDLTKLE